MGVTKGLQFLHHVKHFIHRDLKPSNILLNQAGQIKITDFGVGGQVMATGATASTFIGTINYMAPERLKGGKYTSSVDIWSLGLVVIECATNTFPYQQPDPPAPADDGGEDGGGGLGFWQLLTMIEQQPSPRLPPEAGFSEEAQDFVAQCMNKSPARPTTEALLHHHWLVSASLVDAKRFEKHYKTWVASVTSKIRARRRHEAQEHVASHRALEQTLLGAFGV
eukprot:NODE_1944_length_862_cov_267.134071_g1362_i0.p1 GENE.NODE_1944_length_862_cov_267.134071_g1362_i0~~NODE_1944_length_862_cov_267.134071_g1362_i0.p1  ORF type:complete len:230 (+),score=103.60 NODE_1944_length_862_cov_267.134071_g1362_i0:24-692(+)